MASIVNRGDHFVSILKKLLLFLKLFRTQSRKRDIIRDPFQKVPNNKFSKNECLLKEVSKGGTYMCRDLATYLTLGVQRSSTLVLIVF